MLTDTQTSQGYAERMNDVKQYIRLHIDEPLPRGVLAAVAGFSVSHFHRVFTTQTGESMAGYVRRMRLERAGLNSYNIGLSINVSLPSCLTCGRLDYLRIHQIR